VIQEDSDGHVDLDHLERELVRHGDRALKIGSFSAASNVTGIITDWRAISALLHDHGALSFWDFAAAAPYVQVEMAGVGLDAIFISPHKFIGGPGTPGVLVIMCHADREAGVATITELGGTAVSSVEGIRIGETGAAGGGSPCGCFCWRVLRAPCSQGATLESRARPTPSLRMGLSSRRRWIGHTHIPGARSTSVRRGWGGGGGPRVAPRRDRWPGHGW